jgi:GDPmannose 4,6-dehydratase
MWLALQAEHADNFVFSTGQGRSVLDFFAIALKRVGTEEDPMDLIEFNEELIRPQEKIESLGDSSKALKILGWAPRTSFNEIFVIMISYESESLLK